MKIINLSTMMACTLVDMTKADCPPIDGGLYTSFVIEGSDITGLTSASGEITAFTLAGAASFTKLEADNDNSSFYNQTGQRQTLNNHTYQQQAFLKFGGLSAARFTAAHGTVDCCNLVFVHFINNQKLGIVQGINLDSDTEWSFSKNPARTTINILTDTDENEDRVEITVNSLSKTPSPYTDYTIATLTALVGV